MVLSNNTFDVFFSSPWRVKWRKCVCPSLGLRMRTHPYHPSIQAARKNGTTAKKRKRGKRKGKDGFFLTPSLLFYSCHFSPGLWLSLLVDLVLCSETARKRLLRCLRAAMDSSLPLFGLTLYVLFGPVKSLWFHWQSHILYACFLTIFIMILYYYS